MIIPCFTIKPYIIWFGLNSQRCVSLFKILWKHFEAIVTDVNIALDWKSSRERERAAAVQPRCIISKAWISNLVSSWEE